MEIQIKNLTTFQKCWHYSIGKVNNYCINCNIKLYNGFNFFLGDVVDNGWLCTYTLSMGTKRSISDGKFYIDNRQVDFSLIKKYSYYVNYNEFRLFNRNRTIMSMLKNIDILNSFDIEKTIVKKKFMELNHWSYFCSCLIGLSKGKNILCFPWIPHKEICIQSYRFSLLAEYAKENELVIIIPTDKIDICTNDDIPYSYSIVNVF